MKKKLLQTDDKSSYQSIDRIEKKKDDSKIFEQNIEILFGDGCITHPPKTIEKNKSVQ